MWYISKKKSTKNEDVFLSPFRSHSIPQLSSFFLYFLLPNGSYSIPQKQLMGRYVIFLFTLCVLHMNHSFAQKTGKLRNEKLVQFSGVVVSSDSLMQIPFVSVMIKGSRHGTISDYNGFFSLVAQENDIIEFTAIGFKPATFVIPDSLEDSKYSMIEILSADTFYLKEMLILPWPTKEQFKQAFLSLDLPDDDAARAQRNLDQVRNPEYYGFSGDSRMMNQQLMLQQQNARVYGSGAIPLNNLMNPFAWAKFISDWRSGKLKRQ